MFCKFFPVAIFIVIEDLVWLIVKGSQLNVNTSPGTSVTFDG